MRAHLHKLHPKLSRLRVLAPNEQEEPGKDDLSVTFRKDPLQQILAPAATAAPCRRQNFMFVQ